MFQLSDPQLYSNGSPSQCCLHSQQADRDIPCCCRLKYVCVLQWLLKLLQPRYTKGQFKISRPSCVHIHAINNHCKTCCQSQHSVNVHLNYQCRLKATQPVCESGIGQVVWILLPLVQVSETRTLGFKSYSHQLLKTHLCKNIVSAHKFKCTCELSALNER